MKFTSFGEPELKKFSEGMGMPDIKVFYNWNE
jgi:hypothetical protein